MATETPDFSFEFEKDFLNSELKELKRTIQAKNPEYELPVVFDSSSNMFGGILNMLLMLGLVLFLISMLMRRMGGGAGGGGGPSIFNIGRSKAQLFDQDKKLK